MQWKKQTKTVAYSKAYVNNIHHKRKPQIKFNWMHIKDGRYSKIIVTGNCTKEESEIGHHFNDHLKRALKKLCPWVFPHKLLKKKIIKYILNLMKKFKKKNTPKDYTKTI